MPRKKLKAAKADIVQTSPTETTGTATLEATGPDQPPANEPVAQSEPKTDPRAAQPPVWVDGPPTELAEPAEPNRAWAQPYKALFVSSAKGFEMGENRRFKQRVFTFKERPGEGVIAKLKENGFTYRPAEKAWTIHADASSRLLSEELAQEFAGNERSMSR